MLTSSPPSFLVACVDDDFRVRESIESLLESEGIPVRTFASAEEFLGSGALNDTGLLLLDVRMTGMSGLDLQREVCALRPAQALIFISAHLDDAVRSAALAGGALALFDKPFDGGMLLRAIRDVFRK